MKQKKEHLKLCIPCTNMEKKLCFLTGIMLIQKIRKLNENNIRKYAQSVKIPDCCHAPVRNLKGRTNNYATDFSNKKSKQIATFFYKSSFLGKPFYTT